MISLGGLVLCSLVAGAPAAAAPWPAAGTASGPLRERRPPRFALALPEGTFLRLGLDQKAGDLALEVTAPGANAPQIVDTTAPPRRETLILHAQEAGTYVITLRSAGGPLPGRYDLREIERRPARGDEPLHLRAFALLAGAGPAVKGGTEAERRAALEALTTARDIARTVGDAALEADAQSSIGELQIAFGHTDDALASFDAARACAEAAGDRAGTLHALMQAGTVHNWRDEPDAALARYAAARTLARELGDGASEALVEVNVASSRLFQGDYQAALDHYRAALAVAARHDARRAKAWALTSLARLEHRLGQADPAMRHARQALPLFREVGDARGELGALVNLGVLQRDKGDRRRALASFEAVLARARRLGDRPLQGMALNQLGELQRVQGDAAGAILRFQESAALYEAQGARRARAIALANLASAHADLGHHEEAAARYREALAVSRTTGDPNLEASTLHRLARVETRAGRLDEARGSLESAVALVETLRSRVAGAPTRRSYLASVQDIYEHLIDVLMQLEARQPGSGHAEAALGVSERARARSLLEALREARGDVRRDLPEELLAREDALKRELEQASSRQAKRLASAVDEDEARTLEARVASLLTRYEDLLAEMRQRSPRYAALERPRLLTAGEIREQVGPGTVLVEYALGTERSHAWTVSEGAFRAYVLPPRAAIEAAARAVHDAVSVRPGRGPEASRALRELARLVLAPLAADLAAARVLVVPQGALQHVPFTALPDPASPGDEPLVKRRVVGVLPSASTVAMLREASARPAASRRLAVLADPVSDPDDPRISRKPADAPSLRFPRLAFTRREAEDILAVAGPQDTLAALGFDATRDRILDGSLSTYRTLHLAVHGRLDDRHPESSGLVLSLLDAEGRPQNGLLRMHEVSRLNLGADLVVLSACQTALGPEIRGEGIVSLARAFMHAGVPRVVASLWKVDDAATAALMARFYTALLIEGRAPAEALAQAQRDLAREPRWRSPYFWAAFSLYGEWR